jgi:septation ring formation regulator EzrA
MKADKVAILIMIVLFSLILFTYDRFNHMEQLMTRQRIEGLNLRFDSLIATIKDSEARYRSYNDDLKRMQERVDLIENEKKDLWAKLDNISRDLDGFRTSAAVSANNLDINKKMVELGSISVKRSDKNKK